MKKAKYIFVTILLGALGSAFWEIFLKKFFSLVINSAMPYFLQYVNDSFYTRVTHSLNAPAYETFGFVICTIALLFVMSPKRFAEIYYSYPKEESVRIIQSVIRISCYIILMYDFLVITIASNTARDTITNIEIVAPYITDTEYKRLRSDFFQMDSKSDFENLVEELTSIAEENGLQLK